jgi:hypothetical protein
MLDRLNFCILIGLLFIIHLLLSIDLMKFAIDWLYLLQNTVRVWQLSPLQFKSEESLFLVFWVQAALDVVLPLPAANMACKLM